MVFFLEDVMACTKRLLEWIAGWLPRHFIGAILVSLPALAVYSHVTSEFETNIHVSRITVILCPGSSRLTDHFFFFFNKPAGLRQEFKHRGPYPISPLNLSF